MRITQLFFLLFTLILNTFSLETPYLYRASAINFYSIELSFRNNDVNTENILIIRKTDVTDFEIVATILGTKNSFVDSTLKANTNYTYGLLAINDIGEYSDTSNLLAATTLNQDISFYVPLRPCYFNSTTLTVNFFDSCSIENGFRLHTKINNESWAIVDSLMIDNSSDFDTLKFSINPNDNSWITYKVEAFNDTVSVFSPESTVFFKGPNENFQYYFSKITSIPANPLSWIERVGDSLYFQELIGENDTQIVIIDISEKDNLSFKGFLDINNIPEHLEGTPVGVRVGNSQYKDFLAYLNNYYYTFSNSKLYKYNGSSNNEEGSIDFSNYNIIFQNSYNTMRFNYSFNDSLHVFTFSNSSYDSYSESYHNTFLIKSTSSEFKVLSEINSWSSFYGLGSSWTTGGITGAYNKDILFYYIQNSGDIYDIKYKYYSYYDNYDSIPFKYSYTPNWKNSGFSTAYNFEKRFVIIRSIENYYIHDFTNPYRDNSMHYGFFADSLIDGNIKTVLVDTIKQNVLIFSYGINNQLSLFSYEKGDVGNSNNPKIVHNRKSNNIKIVETNGRIDFNFQNSNPLMLSIYNVRGQMIFSKDIRNKKSFQWNKKNKWNSSISSGFYYVNVKCKDFQMSKSFIVSN